MKAILVFCVVVSVAVLANAFPTEEDVFGELFIDSLTSAETGITPEQIQCIQDSVNKIVEANPQLDWWFKEVEKTALNLVERAKKCDSITNTLEKKRCFLKLKLSAQLEYTRLLKLLPNEDKQIVGTLKQAIEACLK